MPDHPVARKLRFELLPWLMSARLLHRQWFCWTHTLFGYTTDLTIALGSIGIGLPLLKALNSVDSQNDKAQQAVLDVLPRGPLWLYYLALAFAVLWLVLRVAFNREDGQKRAVLAKSCAHSMKQVEARLFRVLALKDPMPELTKMMDEQIGPVIDRSIQDGAYPWSGPAPGIETAVEAKVQELTRQFATQWAAPVSANGPQQM